MDLDTLIANALAEDIGEGDHTSLACIPESQAGAAQLLVKEKGIIAGAEIAEKIFRLYDPTLSVEHFFRDGSQVTTGNVVFRITGKIRSILTCERVVLNCMQRMSGIATLTRKVADQLKGTRTQVLDTRKTTPGFRLLEKMAVKAGGGENHRFGLYDMILVKDNHIDAAGGINEAIGKVNSYLLQEKKNLKVEVEVRSLAELEEALTCGGIHRILFDNFSLADLKKGVERVDGKLETEASGNITPENARQYAVCGVDYISMGVLTHSYKSLDLSLKLIK